MKKNIKKIILFFVNKRNYLRKIAKEMQNIKNKKNIYEKTKLSSYEEKEIDNYFINNYGKKYSNKWHRLYQAYSGKYDVKYFPEILFSTELEEKLNPVPIAKIIEDKSFVDILYGNIKGLKIPKTFVLNCNGIYYSGKREIISYEEAIKKLSNTEEVVFKTTVDSSSGRSIRMYKFKDGKDLYTNTEIEKVFELYNKNFIVQECIKNCDELKELHPNSINTFRVMTYILKDKIYHMPLLLRIGKDGKRVDNAHAGGMFIGVDDNGLLNKTAYTEFNTQYNKHPDTGILFERYKIPKVKEMIEMAKICHGLTPYLKLISWDFTIDDSYKVTLIEVNTTGQSIWLPQIAHGCGAFESNTEYMYNLIKK